MKVLKRPKALLVAAGLLALPIYFSPSGTSAAQPDAAACQALATTDFSSIQDAPTQVMEAAVVDGAGDVPAYCHVQGYVAPQVGFELKLPMASWNGRFVEIGAGGTAGSTRFGFLIVWCNGMLETGSACIVTDLGHSTSRAEVGNAGADGLWASNNLQARLDWGIRAAHVGAVAGKAITQRFYGSAPRFSYFIGSSGGGRQGLMEAQRFAWDFDGIVVVDPSIRLAMTVGALLWNAQVNSDATGKPVLTATDLAALNDAVMSSCDASDGLKDGIISDPRACEFDPGEAACRAGRTSKCLSPVQLEAVRKIYSGPVTANGTPLFYGAMRGSETGLMFTNPSRFGTDMWRFMGLVPDAGSPGNTLNFEADFKRLGAAEALYDTSNPDLRRFKARGGKLILSQGWDDSGSPMPLSTLDYYEMVEKTMGGPEKTRDFARLFMIPGKAHGPGGPGADSIDYMSYIEAWVEQGRAPDMMIGAHVMHEHRKDSFTWGDYVAAPKDVSRVKFTRPHYPHPLQARYKKGGDPNDYRSFEPVQPAAHRPVSQARTPLTAE